MKLLDTFEYVIIFLVILFHSSHVSSHKNTLYMCKISKFFVTLLMFPWDACLRPHSEMPGNCQGTGAQGTETHTPSYDTFILLSVQFVSTQAMLWSDGHKHFIITLQTPPYKFLLPPYKFL